MGRLLPIIAILCNLLQLSIAYQTWEEANYLNNFDELESKSYSAVNDPALSPSNLLSECSRPINGTDVPFDGSRIDLEADGIDDNNPNILTVSASSAQEQCDRNSNAICTVPHGVRLIMSSSLNVPALIVKGEVYWRDIDQIDDVQYLCAGYVAVEGNGKFIMNVGSSSDSTSTKKAWIYIKDNGAVHPQGRSRFFGGVGSSTTSINNFGPTIDITGRKLSRTWSLLAEPFKNNEVSLKLLHSPIRMGWKVGDRIGISPTQKGSDGTGHTYKIVALDDDGTVTVDTPNTNEKKAIFLPPKQAVYNEETRTASLLSAEVVNLSRNIIITGDDLRHVPCENNVSHTSGCKCSEHKTKCTVGLHTAQMNDGTMRIRNVRVEKCGQRGIVGKYCLHFHRLSSCPDCEFSNNAVEHSHQRGIIVHGTHQTNVENNVLWDVRGAGIYIEDGNEMANTIKYNVVVCPWSLAHPTLHGCTVPGTDNAESDTPLNQAGIYMDTAANDMIGNRASNSFNGLLLQASGSGKGAAYGRVCTNHLAFGRWEGNTLHGHSRFGLYSLGGSTPRNTDQSIEADGFNLNQGTCAALTNDGLDRGKPVSILNNVDYDTVFVGHYNAGDMQHRGHTSHGNNNLIYWKETKNFADGCAAHLSDGYYAHGNMALPDQGTFIIERTVFDVYVVLEANHHCNVGVTGLLCMPQYILHDVSWKVTKGGAWVWLQRGGTGGGGVFSVSPPNAQVVMSGQPLADSIFPPGYVSVASGHYTYLKETNLCVSSNDLGLGDRYTNGILCEESLRVLKIWSTNLQASTAPSLKVEVWLNSTGVSDQSIRDPDITQLVNFHVIANLGGGKQGYSLPVFLSTSDVSYRISLDRDNSAVPGDFIIEFSDPVMGNRWGEEFLYLSVEGRVCENDGVISSQHDRRHTYGLGFSGSAWGNSGACVNSNPPPKMDSVDCSIASVSGEEGTIPATECPELCSEACDSSNSFCHCGLATCTCKPGFSGADCSIDMCAQARCGEHGTCSAQYLGDASTLPVSNQACICDNGWFGSMCDQQQPTNIARQGTASQSSTCWGGPASRAIDGNTNQYWGSNTITHTCQEESPWWEVDLGSEKVIGTVILYNRWDDSNRDRFNDCVLEILDENEVVVASKTIINSMSNNYFYFDDITARFVRIQKNVYGDMNIAELQVYNGHRGCNCPLVGDCQESPRCNTDGSCPTESTSVVNGTPCNSKPYGTCQDGQCVEPLTPSPTFEPTLAPFTLTPTMYNPADLSNLALGNLATASQSSTCHGGPASRAIDGNTDGNWYHNSVQHTCNEANTWWKVDLGANIEHIINQVKVFNRNDCCTESLVNTEVQILNEQGTVVDSKPITSISGVYTLNFDNVAGRSVRVYKTSGGGGLTIAEVQVFGWQITQSPTISPSISPSTPLPTLKPTLSKKPTYSPNTSQPTETLINLARVAGATAQQSSTYQSMGPYRAIDGVKTNGSNNVPTTHTQCSDSPSPWWRVYFGVGEIKTVKVYNRNDCCWSRLKDFTVSVLDDNMAVVSSQFYSGVAPRYEAASFDFTDVSTIGTHVEVKLGSPDCLSLTEVEVFGHQITPPPTNLARGSNAVSSQSSTCHGGGANRANDGNTNGMWGGNSVQHTCQEQSPWWKVDLGSEMQHTISRIEVYNRMDCCMDRFNSAEVQVLDAQGTVVASQPIQGSLAMYTFDFDNVAGQAVRVQKNVFGDMNIAEVKVMGWSEDEDAAPTTSPPTITPLPCDDICPGSYPYGCADNLPAKVAYGCLPSGGCNYLEEGQEYPHDGFCTFKGSVVSAPETLSPSSSPNTPLPCDGICPGSYPYGCADNLPAKVAYGCMPSGGCNYLEEGQEYPHDGFCTFKGTIVSTPETSSPSTSPIIEPCSGICPGSYPYGCATNLQGKVAYGCLPSGGCKYLAEGEDYPNDSFCTYKGAVSTPETSSPSTSPIVSTPMPIAPQVTYCGCSTCTDTVWNTQVTDGAGTHSCGDRITWLQSFEGGSNSESAACTQVGNEFSLDQCGPACNPDLCNDILEEPNPDKLLWSDEFDIEGTPDPTKWDYDLGDGCPELCSWGNQEEAFYTSDEANVNITNGKLQITARKEAGFTRPYTSSRMVTRGLHSFKYGRIQIRASLAKCKARGTWPALWMLPEDKVYGEWPNSGEIDIMESVGHESNLFHQTVHTATFNGMIGTQQGRKVSRSKDDFHTWEIDWQEDIIKFAVDGQVYFKYNKSGGSDVWPFDQRFHLIMNLAVGGTWGGANGVDGAAFEGEGQTMEVDWIRVYGDATPPPSISPSSTPTTSLPSIQPTKTPSKSPSKLPTASPTSEEPTFSPSISPSTSTPTLSPSNSPVRTPTISPSLTSTTLAPVNSSQPIEALINLARVAGATAQQSSTYQSMGPYRAIDGVKTNGSNNVPTTHTQCSDSPSPWWRVYFGEGEVKTVNVYNRQECCWDRLSNFTVSVLDDNMAVVASRHYPGTAPRYDAVQFDFTNTAAVGSYVEVKLGSPNCLSLTEVEVFGRQIKSPPTNIVQAEAVTASQSSTCHGGGANRAIDGNTNGNYYSNSVQHTCNEAQAWFKVDLGANLVHTINQIVVYNRNDCCMNTLINTEVQILDEQGTVIDSKPITTSSSVYTFDFDNVVGRFVRVQKNVFGGFTIAEVKVMGWSLTEDGLPPPTNIARQGTASQSSTCWGGGPNRAIDGNTNGQWGGNSVQHTCNEADPWWQVNLDNGGQRTISQIKIYNRSDCCMDRFGNSEVQILDAQGTVVASQPIQGALAVYTFDFDNVSGQTVRVQKIGSGALNIAEVKVMGY